MANLILDREQTKLVTRARKRVQVCDSQGKVLGIMVPVFNEQEIEEAERLLFSEKDWHTTREVREHLHGLGKP